MIKKVIGILLVFLCTGAFANLEKGFKALEKGKLEKAEAYFISTLNENEHSTSAHYGLALIYENKGYEQYDLEQSYISIHRAKEIFYLHETNDKLEMASSGVNLTKINQVSQRIESELLDKISHAHTLEAFVHYIQKHRDASNLDQAILLRNRFAFEEALNKNTIRSYQSFINKYPKALEVNEAKRLRNRIAFKKVKQEHTVKAFSEFIDTYPNADEISEANKIRNQLAYIELLEKEQELKHSELERSESERIQQELQIENHEEHKRTLQVGLGLTFFVLVIAGYAYYQKRNDNSKLTLHKQKIESQKKRLEVQTDKIMDSIRYAGAIQQAILPPIYKIKESFDDAFVMHKPKDIVSGDFFWFTEKDGKKIIAAIDCTGHGVPGAFMSMIGNTLLNQTVKIKGLVDPSEILSELRKQVINSLNQNGQQTQQDGMDIALCVISEDKIEFAGAFNPLIHIRNELTEIKADRMPIGRHFKKEGSSFTKHTVDLQKGDLIYIYSDGFADQFGGPNSKKYTSKKFKNLLIDIHELPCNEQENRLAEELDSWKGINDQIDDILIIGMRV